MGTPRRHPRIFADVARGLFEQHATVRRLGQVRLAEHWPYGHFRSHVDALGRARRVGVVGPPPWEDRS